MYLLTYYALLVVIVHTTYLIFEGRPHLDDDDLHSGNGWIIIMIKIFWVVFIGRPMSSSGIHRVNEMFLNCLIFQK